MNQLLQGVTINYNQTLFFFRYRWRIVFDRRIHDKPTTVYLLQRTTFISSPRKLGTYTVYDTRGWGEKLSLLCLTPSLTWREIGTISEKNAGEKTSRTSAPGRFSIAKKRWKLAELYVCGPHSPHHHSLHFFTSFAAAMRFSFIITFLRNLYGRVYILCMCLWARVFW